MKLITKKSECKRIEKSELVKSPKEAIRKTLSNYLIKDGLIIKAYLPSYVSKEEMVLRNQATNDEVSVKLTQSGSIIKVKN